MGSRVLRLPTRPRPSAAALALASVPPLLLSQALVALIARRPGLYARHREPLLIAAFLVHNHTNVLFSERALGRVLPGDLRRARIWLPASALHTPRPARSGATVCLRPCRPAHP